MPETVVRPWLALWFRPRAAIDAVLARRSGATALLIALAVPLTAVVAAFPDAVSVFRLPPGQAAVFAALGALAVLALAFVGFYVNGWLVNAASRIIGGRGTAAATRAAYGWSAAPMLAGNIAALATAHELATIGIVAQGIAMLWSLALCIAMLSRVQAFGRLRACIGLLGGSLAPALVIALVFRAFLLQPFSVPSGSMAPTLQVGDYFFAAKLDYGYGRYSFPFNLATFEGRYFAHAPQRGDVVVFRHNGQDWVKRIVGLPGEKIQLIAGRLRINGELVERRAAPGFRMLDSRDQPITAPTYLEILPGGVAHRILQLEGDDGRFSNTEAFEVPPGRYFVLGDNRDNSMDSRMPEVGMVALDDMIGRAAVIFYSRANDPEAPGRPQLDRIGTPVR